MALSSLADLASSRQRDSNLGQSFKSWMNLWWFGPGRVHCDGPRRRDKAVWCDRRQSSLMALIPGTFLFLLAEAKQRCLHNWTSLVRRAFQPFETRVSWLEGVVTTKKRGFARPGVGNDTYHRSPTEKFWKMNCINSGGNAAMGSLLFWWRMAHVILSRILSRAFREHGPVTRCLQALAKMKTHLVLSSECWARILLGNFQPSTVCLAGLLCVVGIPGLLESQDLSKTKIGLHPT